MLPFLPLGLQQQRLGCPVETMNPYKDDTTIQAGECASYCPHALDVTVTLGHRFL